MATEKVGIYRKYHGKIPTDKSGQALPKSEWPRKRAFRWAVRWFGSDGKRYSKSFKKRKEAERFSEKRQSDVRSGKADPPTKISLRNYYREHKELMQGNVAPKTLRLHLDSIELLAEIVGWDHQLNIIGVRDIERFRSKRLKIGIAPATANKELKTLRRIFNLAILRGYLTQTGNPCNGIPMLKVCSKLPEYIRPEDFHKIYGFAPDSLWQAYLVTLYTTALRLREAMNLTWQDIDFESNQLHVTRKTNNGFVQAWTPKDHELRSIPLPVQTVGLLATWQSIAPEECPYVFMEQGRWDYYRNRMRCGKWRSGQDLVNNVLRRLKTICRKAGVGPYTIHDIRRSCITNWAKKLPIHVVQQLAGHSDIKTTQRFYLSVQPEDVSKAQAIQTSILGKLPTTDLTDPKLTHSGQKRIFPGSQGKTRKKQLFD